MTNQSKFHFQRVYSIVFHFVGHCSWPKRAHITCYFFIYHLHRVISRLWKSDYQLGCSFVHTCTLADWHINNNTVMYCIESIHINVELSLCSLSDPRHSVTLQFNRLVKYAEMCFAALFSLIEFYFSYRRWKLIH